MYDGVTIVLDGRDLETVVWQVEYPDTESYRCVLCVVLCVCMCRVLLTGDYWTAACHHMTALHT